MKRKIRNSKAILSISALTVILCFSECKKEVQKEIKSIEIVNPSSETLKLERVTRFLSTVLNVPIENIKYNKSKNEFMLFDKLKMDGKEVFIKYDEANVYKLNFEK